MHELSICERLIDLLDEERQRRGFRVVTRLKVEIGQLSCLDPDAFRFAFEVFTRDTFVENAELAIDRPMGEATCLDCGAKAAVGSRTGTCPDCGGERLDAVGGDGIHLVELMVR